MIWILSIYFSTIFFNNLLIINALLENYENDIFILAQVFVTILLGNTSLHQKDDILNKVKTT